MFHSGWDTAESREKKIKDSAPTVRGIFHTHLLLIPKSSPGELALVSLCSLVVILINYNYMLWL
jgi:hypothetical protein